MSGRRNNRSDIGAPSRIWSVGDWRIFDALPIWARRVLQDATIQFHHRGCAAFIREGRRGKASVSHVADALARACELAEVAELSAFAAAYEAEFGTKLPHVAARTAAMRYGERAP
ncbi:MAG TPA: hypothetical protein VNE67_17255 [Acetobacteraceae bacterium]|nr:hypothetical protein [Stellaceae bacterium]HVB69599.1 hypothetical protein [Acetobacteraceae bacterium]